MQQRLLLALALGLLAAKGSLAGGASDLAGHWRTDRYGALVQITDCGDGTPCGRLTWLDPRVTQGTTHDVRNGDPGQRGRALLGLPILWGFASGKDGWRDGRLYNPADGMTFRAHLGLLSSSALRVTGCLGPLCRSEVWTRAAGETAAADRTSP
ncbi:DUF2147 domain-containing protein [Rubrivivax sp. RP6-9]|uniref:DUF2147 domain-containing protein n=1 Tax=Rubrivivax sp. RP6-9 TaxID=3415750 RepID=UPI003CC597B1